MTTTFDPNHIKNDFPLFSQSQFKDYVYLDSAATSQKPQVVIDAISEYYASANANVHRGVHRLSDASTQALMEARKTIASFFSAEPSELILVRNTTEAINGVAYGWGDYHLSEGDEIISSVMEHHANLVPWQELCKRTGAVLKLIPVKENDELDFEWYEKHLNKRVKLVALQHVSNALGTLHPVEKYCKLAHTVGARFLLDAAQSAPHMPINFHTLKADFLAFSGHKMLGPMGIGGLLVRSELLETNEMKPWLFGGGMIAQVAEQSTEYHPDASDRFAAGTPDVASAVGLATACEYLVNLTMSAVQQHDQGIVQYTLESLAKMPQVVLLGPTTLSSSTAQFGRVGSVSFLYKGVHPHDVAQVLDSRGVAVRSGHHCCMPLHTHFGWSGSVRASFFVYTAKSDIDRLVTALEDVAAVFK